MSDIQKVSPPSQVYLNQSNLGFRFLVRIGPDNIAAFTECKLPDIEWDVQVIKEGGQNAYDHQLPGKRKSNRLTLINGVGKSGLMSWYMEILANRFMRRDITVTLNNPLGKPIVSWLAAQAYPVKWSGPQLKTDTNSIAIQTIEFACTDFILEYSEKS